MIRARPHRHPATADAGPPPPAIGAPVMALGIFAIAALPQLPGGAARYAGMARRPPADLHLALLEPWLDELDRLARRRADNRDAIDAHLARLERALAEWQTITGGSARAYRARFRQRIDAAIASPWPMTASRRDKLLYARQRLADGAALIRR